MFNEIFVIAFDLFVAASLWFSRGAAEERSPCFSFSFQFEKSNKMDGAEASNLPTGCVGFSVGDTRDTRLSVRASAAAPTSESRESIAFVQ